MLRGLVEDGELSKGRKREPILFKSVDISIWKENENSASWNRQISWHISSKRRWAS